jgi:hypothetical protein
MSQCRIPKSILYILVFFSFQFDLPDVSAEVINPYPRSVIQVNKLKAWDFAAGLEGFRPANDCMLIAKEGMMVISTTGNDPYLYSPRLDLAGPFTVRLRLRGIQVGRGQIFWISDKQPNWGEPQSRHFDVEYDDQWHEYDVHLPAKGSVRHIRLDPGSGLGTVEIDRIEIISTRWHPLELIQVESEARQIKLHLKNHEKRSIPFTLESKRYTVEADRTKIITLNLPDGPAFEAKTIVIQPDGLPEISRTVFLYRGPGRLDGVTRKSKDLTLRVARDGTGAELEIDGKVIAILAPLVQIEGKVPKLLLIRQDDAIRLHGEGIQLEMKLNGNELKFSLNSNKECEGPVVRALGDLEQGVFAGLEYLGQGEHSSSKLDIETEEHIRFAPDILKVTMPLMSCLTDSAAVALTWEDMYLQPVYATPNFFDGARDHRMALRGTNIEATILVKKTSLEDTILWATKKIGLPDLPQPPRSWEQQKKLCLDSINGPVSGDNGWAHCAEDRWPRHPFADHASTIWRLTGEAPKPGKIVPGGAHIPNDAIFFVTGRTQQWLQQKKNMVRGILSRQQSDGSFRYNGKFRRGHFEDTASGTCALPARQLLEYAWITGDQEALKGGEKTLEYMKRFSTPRGAQTWEVALHTPDILASANLVWAYVRGYELTGKKEYLQQARKWALSGVPFVYLWGDYPIMAYGTIPVFGATNWIAPNWMGLPVQWCGLDYAYAIALFAPYDNTIDWRKLAEGILIAGEQMQYPAGEFIGTLPDSLVLRTQQRRPWNINPCALISLRLLLSGQVDSLSVAANKKHRVAAPFPVEIKIGKTFIHAQKGVKYQVLIDGERIINVTSKGLDTISLDK